jgi:hypothetical protein
MSPALRISPRLRALTRAGLLRSFTEDYRYRYVLTTEGKRRLEEGT